MSPRENLNKISFEESLGAQVINAGKCAGCGACIVACPFGCLEYKDGKSVLVKECKICGICARVCPRYEQSQTELEKYVFGKERNVEQEFGVYRHLAVAQATDSRILSVSQDGGVVTALLLFALENKLIDGAVVSGVKNEKPCLPIPKLATDSKEVLECSGTRYFYSPNILALPEAVKQKKTSLAFVGTPCQIQAIRKAQKAGLKFALPVKYLIGLMCSECFTYEGLMEKHIRTALGLDPNAIRKVNIKGKMLVTTDSGVHAIPLAEIKQYARENCKYCDDFSSELADISAGGLGMGGWTFGVVRTERGEELFEGAEKAGIIRTRDVKEEPNALNLLCRLAKKKKRNLVS
jgi:coenzyme F420 hydrogenase subunit beta